MSDISAEEVKRLRQRTGAGMMDSKKALQEAGGDMDRAVEILRERGLASAQKRAGRSATQGVIDAYIHHNNTVGVLVEVNCETDFVAKTEEFRRLARNVALHIASAMPQWVTREEVPEEILETERRIYEAEARQKGKPDNALDRIVEGKLQGFFKTTVLLDQPFVKEPEKTIQQLIDEVSAKVGEKVAVRRFVRYKLGEDLE
ncbi:MAG TPA: translation elongation factor Ts [Actinomycetota bacterium]|jgi:elongation factor Ts|nr:translation elongation factor Ts [Actinomycetota bacterium]